MVDQRDKYADAFTEGIGSLMEHWNPNSKVIRFTPSVKLGRRYLAVQHTDGYTYSIQVDVWPTPTKGE